MGEARKAEATLPAGSTESQAQSINRPVLAHFRAVSPHPSTWGPRSDLSSSPLRGQRMPRGSSLALTACDGVRLPPGARGASARGSLRSPRGRVVWRERGRVREGRAG